MSLFGSDALERIDEDFRGEIDSVVEMMIVTEASKMGEEDLKAWCESEEAQALVEANVLRKPTLMRLSKADDEKRRVKIACYTIAKAANDPIYFKMRKAYILKKQLSAKLVAKYGNKATRIAKQAQKEYIKNYGKKVLNKKEKAMAK